MKRFGVFIYFTLFFLFNSFAQTNVESSLKSIRESGNLIKSIKYNSEKNKEEIPIEESMVYYIKNNKEQINNFLQAIQRDRPTATMSMQSIKEGKVKSEILIYRLNSKQITYMIEIEDDFNAEISYIKSKIKVETNSKGEGIETSGVKSNTNKYLIPKGGHMNINGQKVSAEEARALGFDVEEVDE